MRIISGRFKGKILFGPTHNMRPTLDKVKQGLFTKLLFKINNASVLDLFSGSGAMGIEAVSRNAKKVVFSDNSKKSIELLRKNISGLKIDKSKVDIQILFCDYKIALKKLRNEKFDLIIIDPPYESEYYEDILNTIFEQNMLNENGYIVCERLKDKGIGQNNFILESTKTYGKVSLDYFVK